MVPLAFVLRVIPATAVKYGPEAPPNLAHRAWVPTPADVMHRVDSDGDAGKPVPVPTTVMPANYEVSRPRQVLQGGGVIAGLPLPCLEFVDHRRISDEQRAQAFLHLIFVEIRPVIPAGEGHSEGVLRLSTNVGCRPLRLVKPAGTSTWSVQPAMARGQPAKAPKAQASSKGSSRKPSAVAPWCSPPMASGEETLLPTAAPTSAPPSMAPLPSYSVDFEVAEGPSRGSRSRPVVAWRSPPAKVPRRARLGGRLDGGRRRIVACQACPHDRLRQRRRAATQSSSSRPPA